MAGSVLPPVFTPFGPDGPNVYLSKDANPPSHAGDGSFDLGDWVINTAPTAGGTLLWVCTGAGTGATATFKAVAIAS